jgi:hypothetical protein
MVNDTKEMSRNFTEIYEQKWETLISCGVWLKSGQPIGLVSIGISPLGLKFLLLFEILLILSELFFLQIFYGRF